MNGRVSKRIRRAAAVISKPGDRHNTAQRLKREYKILPYHRRKTPEVIGHSALLRRGHAREAVAA